MNKKPLAILDSGAFSAHNIGVQIKMEDYLAFLSKNKQFFPGGFINLDVIGDGKKSYENWKEMRRQGFDSIPVYHVSSDEKWLAKYMKQTDYVAIGAIANLNTKARISGLSYIWKKYILDEMGKPKIRTHGLGLTSLQLLTKFPWYSVDSFIATKQAAFGAVTVPHLSFTKVGNEIRYKYKQEDDFIQMFISNQNTEGKEASINNFHSLSKLTKEVYTKYFNDRGYEVGDYSHTIKKKRKKKKDQNKTISTPLFSMHTEPTEKEIQEMEKKERNSLMGYWGVRFNYNLEYWKEIQEKKKTIIYHGVSDASHLEDIVRNDLPFLVSYYYLLGKENKLLKKIKEKRGIENAKN